MSSLRLLLLPFSLLYAGVIKLRNSLFDLGVFSTARYDFPLICIGNLKVGGTGKTPFAEMLVRLLGDHIRIATLSRGYGRKTKGLLMATFPADASLVGDEPAQFKNKFPGLDVCVAEDRRLGIVHLQELGARLILLDDAFQHRRVNCGLNIVLMEYSDLFRPVLFLPAGNYREPRSSLNRADMVVITKTPVPVTDQLYEKARCFTRIGSGVPLFFAGITYGQPVRLYGLTGPPQLAMLQNATSQPATSQPFTKQPGNSAHDASLKLDWVSLKKAVLLTGIANPGPLVSFLKGQGIEITHHAYADHHLFSRQNIVKLAAAYQALKGEGTFILTTEKDAQRLRSGDWSGELAPLPVYYVPIMSEILSSRNKEFESIIFEYVNAAL